MQACARARMRMHAANRISRAISSFKPPRIAVRGPLYTCTYYIYNKFSTNSTTRSVYVSDRHQNKYTYLYYILGRTLFRVEFRPRGVYDTARCVSHARVYYSTAALGVYRYYY
jgi:hypothetical protein